MLSLAKSPLAPVLGQRVPLRGPARMLFSSYARTRYQPQRSRFELLIDSITAQRYLVGQDPVGKRVRFASDKDARIALTIKGPRR